MKNGKFPLEKIPVMQYNQAYEAEFALDSAAVRVKTHGLPETIEQKAFSEKF